MQINKFATAGALIAGLIVGAAPAYAATNLVDTAAESQRCFQATIEFSNVCQKNGVSTEMYDLSGSAAILRSDLVKKGVTRETLKKCGPMALGIRDLCATAQKKVATVKAGVLANEKTCVECAAKARSNQAGLGGLDAIAAAAKDSGAAGQCTTEENQAKQAEGSLLEGAACVFSKDASILASAATRGMTFLPPVTSKACSSSDGSLGCLADAAKLALQTLVVESTQFCFIAKYVGFGSQCKAAEAAKEARADRKNRGVGKSANITSHKALAELDNKLAGNNQNAARLSFVQKAEGWAMAIKDILVAMTWGVIETGVNMVRENIGCVKWSSSMAAPVCEKYASDLSCMTTSQKISMYCKAVGIVGGDLFAFAAAGRVWGAAGKGVLSLGKFGATKVLSPTQIEAIAQATGNKITAVASMGAKVDAAIQSNAMKAADKYLSLKATDLAAVASKEGVKSGALTVAIKDGAELTARTLGVGAVEVANLGVKAGVVAAKGVKLVTWDLQNAIFETAMAPGNYVINKVMSGAEKTMGKFAVDGAKATKVAVEGTGTAQSRTTASFNGLDDVEGLVVVDDLAPRSRGGIKVFTTEGHAVEIHSPVSIEERAKDLDLGPKRVKTAEGEPALEVKGAGANCGPGGRAIRIVGR